jgi:hypothetical protein
MLGGTPARESPRLHAGGLLASATCTTSCRLQVGGYVTVGGSRVRVISSGLSFSGFRHIHIRLTAPGGRLLQHLLASRRTGQAHLTFTATSTSVPSDTTVGVAVIRLLA